MIFRNGNQAFINIDPQVAVFIAEDPLSFVESLSPRQRKVFNCLLYWATTTGAIYITQEKLAQYAGFASREHVNRVIAKFVEWGLIASRYRYMTSCVYKVSSFFNDFKIRSLLKKYLSSLSYFPKQLLEPKVTLYISTYIYTTYNLYSSYLLRLLNVGACAQEEGVRVPKKESRVMEQGIKPYVDCIESPSMTMQQQIQLSQYSEDTVKYALKQLQRARDVQSPVGFLLGVCRNHVTRSTEPRSGSGRVKEIKNNTSVPRTKTAPEREVIDRRRIAYLASMRGESAEYCQQLQDDPRTFKEVKRDDDARSASLLKTKRQESLKANGDFASQDELLTTSRLLDPSFTPTTPTERMAQVAARQRQSSQRQIGDIMPRLIPVSSEKMVAPTITPRRIHEGPQIQTNIDLDEPEPSGGYDESEYEEIF